MVLNLFYKKSRWYQKKFLSQNVAKIESFWSFASESNFIFENTSVSHTM